MRGNKTFVVRSSFLEFLGASFIYTLAVSCRAVLVTGIKGFIGRNLASALLKHGFHVLGLSRTSSDIEINGTQIRVLGTDCDFPEALSSYSIDVIVHSATNYGYSNNAKSVYTDNFLMPQLLFNYCNSRGLRLFINLDTYVNKTELTYSKLPDYALSKRLFLEWLKANNENNLLNLRLEHVYGPDDHSYKFFPTAISSIAIDKLPAFYASHGRQKRDFVYISNVTEMILKCIQVWNPSTFETVYELGTSKSTSIRELLQRIKEISESPTKLEFGALNHGDALTLDSVADNSFSKDFGYNAFVGIQEGIEEMIRCLRIRQYE
jgi:nucleoside-diphosphate-sugar epimerase